MGDTVRRLSGLLFLCVAVAYAGKLVAILETGADRGVPLKMGELRFLTDELRSQALQVLPVSRGFEIMTRENIQTFLQELVPSGKNLEECLGECLVETGRNLSADYVAQGRVGILGKNLTLTVELYETQSARLVGSFTGEAEDAGGLLRLLREQAPVLFGKIGVVKAKPPAEERLGIIGLKTDDDEESGSSGLLVEVISEPEGAAVAVDGRPIPGCAAAPCRVEVAPGVHSFYAVLDAYADQELRVNIREAGQKVVLKLSPNFGTLILNPKLGEGWDPSLLDIKVGGQTLGIGAYRLAPGQHPVRISHPCAQGVSFSVGLKKGSVEIYDHPMKPRMAGLTLKAEHQGIPIKAPVWVDGRQVGQTPWSGQVPLCGLVEVGDEKARLDVRLDPKKMTTVVYEKP